ncbi:MAG TPA: exodeoxyribonuclease VII small subunit [Candidatus Krumholzibacteria bacterium]
MSKKNTDTAGKVGADEAANTESFEKALERLEGIVQKLEDGELTLEESLRLYEDGIRLSRLCHGQLEEAEGRIELLVKDARGAVASDSSGRPRSRALDAPDESGAGTR